MKSLSSPIFFYHPDFNCRFRNFTGSVRRSDGVADYHRRSGISPCPEESSIINAKLAFFCKKTQK